MYILPLKTKKKDNFYFVLNDSIKKKLILLSHDYESLPAFDKYKSYKDNMIRTSLSDINIESDLETSVIESLSAIVCKKIKNKNQKTALNLLNMLENGVLEEEHCLSNEYIIKIWKELTFDNRNIESRLNQGYRNISVVVRKKKGFSYQIEYKAPDSKDVPFMMDDLISFMNNDIVANDNFYNSVLKAIIFSQYFVYVHPFLDGNGRVSRLLMNKFLIDSGFDKFRYVSINMGISRTKKLYNTLLKNVEMNDSNDLTEYIDYLLSVLITTFESILSPKTIKANIDKLSDRQKVMLRYIKSISTGISVKAYKSVWNKVAKENGYDSITIRDAENDIVFMFNIGLLVIDDRYVKYPGFKFFNK